jgi:sulfoxide reductase catalytic subunit YedY
MLIKRKRGWELPESRVTPEAIYHERRTLLKGLAAGPILLGAPALLSGAALAETTDPTASLYPFPHNNKFTPGKGRKLTPYKIATTYNNFYEFGSQKQIWQAAQALKSYPWTVTIDGMVEKPFKIDVDALLKKMPREERIYRHRCVEAWSMVVPWSGFPLKALVALAKPLGSAKYLTMHSFKDPSVAPIQRQSWQPWPYTEGLAMFEATNDLAFLVTGLYGKPVPDQNGAPIRLHTPWKYGFKSAKSIVRFTFTDKMPKTFWIAEGNGEYGFWANVNPKVPHRRWSQAHETDIGTRERIPTLEWNGYGDYVAGMYASMKGQNIFK